MIKLLNPKHVKYLVVHCSDSRKSPYLGAKDIHDWHTHHTRGFDCIGYHSVIRAHGQIELGRPTYLRGAHVRNMNWCSLGVCLIGRHNFSLKQKEALKCQLASWLEQFPDARIAGHYQFDDNKTCPNFDVPEWAAAAGFPDSRIYTPA